MSDDLTRYLTSDSPKPKVAPETLEVMGKQAASQFLSSGVALNEAIVKLAAGQHLGVDQVKRVCEFANNAAYLGLHDKNKTAGAESSYPQFELADAGRVVQDLAVAAKPTLRPAEINPSAADYGRQPVKAKLASATTDNLLADLFNVKEAEARADLDFTRSSAINDIVDTKQDLTSLKDTLTSAAAELNALHEEATEDYYKVAKAHLLEGHGFEDVLAAAGWSPETKSKVSSILQPVVARLIKEKVAAPADLTFGLHSLAKVAHRVIDETHPLVAHYREIASIDTEISKIAASLADVDVELDRVNAFLKKQIAG